MTPPVIVSFGGGTNSTALLVGMYERATPPALIMFADTGGEKPHTYEHILEVNAWLRTVSFPTITTVKKQRRSGEVLTLEQNCLEQHMLPSIAYGYKGCSQKYKIAPQERFANHWAPAREVWLKCTTCGHLKNEHRRQVLASSCKTCSCQAFVGGKVVKYIGYDAGEGRRAKIQEDAKYTYVYPLIEWGWGREECVDAIKRAGISQPGKSSCFFCPNSKPSEIRWLGEKHPDLLRRCFTMETNAAANLTTIKGLGRRYSWESLYSCNLAVPDTAPDQPCGCYDGDDD